MTQKTRSSSTGLELSRRELLRLSALGVVGYSMSGWLEALAAGAGPRAARSCIVLWMTGGPSQLDTFDLKPGHANGGPFREIQTSVPRIRISEHLPRIARYMDDIAIIRSMTSREGDHEQADHYAHTGYRRDRTISYPPLGSLVSAQLGRHEAALPNFVSVGAYRPSSASALQPGFLGPTHGPLIFAETNGPARQNLTDSPPLSSYDQLFRLQNLGAPVDVTAARVHDRIDLLGDLDREFVTRHPGNPGRNAEVAARSAIRLMRTDGNAFDLTQEPVAVREAYGRSLFGQGCLLARRLVERGVSFVEVALSNLDRAVEIGWDTHSDNFRRVRLLSEILDPAWSALLADLEARGLLDTTLIVWMGEFGRTPVINSTVGRDHYPNAWSAALAGCGVRGGQVVGRTSDDGTTIEERPVSVPDLLATICTLLGVEHTRLNPSNIGRPIAVVDRAARPIQEVLPS